MVTVIGAIVGIIGRLLPEVIKLFTLKKDQDHEYRMTKLQLEIDAARASQEIDKIHANEMLEAVRGEMTAYAEAIKSQGQLTGIKWIDGLNQSVRPIVTYWWMFLFTVYKLSGIIYALIYWTSLELFLKNVWNEFDSSVLSTILGFWFVDRALRYTMKR